MSKAPRFPIRLDAWVDEPTANAVQLVADHAAITASAVVRQSRDLRNLDYWANRASRNSDTARGNRATGSGRLSLSPTGPVDLHSTSAPPRHDAAVDARMISDGEAYSAAIPD